MDTIKDTINGSVEFEIKDAQGNVIDSGSKKNLITNVAHGALAALAGGTSTSYINYLALGTSSTAPSVTDTTLGAELTTGGLGRSLATVSYATTSQTNDTLVLTYTWTSSISTTVREIGVFNASSGGALFGHLLTGDKVLAPTNTFTATYKIQF
jgi:hypothetical protein